MFIAESPKVIQRALDAGYQPISFLVEDRHLETQARELIDQCGDLPVYTAPFDVLTQLTGFKLTRGMLCAMRRPPLPTVEQVSELIHALEIEPFEETEVCEILVRPWKVVPGRLRPNDRMAAHTAFLVFTRMQERSADWDALIPLGTRERKQEAARQARLADARGEEWDYDV